MIKIPKFGSFLEKYLVNIDEVYKDTPIAKDFPDILLYLKNWNMQATILRIIHVVLAGLATFFSVLTATLANEISVGSVQFFAFIAAISIAFLTSFNLTEKSNNTRKAWRTLNTAVMSYNNGEIDKKDLIKKYEEGEQLIGDVLFSRAS